MNDAWKGKLRVKKLENEKILSARTIQGVLFHVRCHTWTREMDQMRRAMEEMGENMGRTNHIDDLVHRTNSPFIASINSQPRPSKFKMPWICMMEHVTRVTILQPSRPQCIVKEF